MKLQRGSACLSSLSGGILERWRNGWDTLLHTAVFVAGID